MIPTDTFADALNEQLSINLGLALIHEDEQQFIDGMSEFLESEAQQIGHREGTGSLLPVLFSTLPKSSNHYNFQSIKLPKRNDPCLCGSGKKLKKCCPQILDIPAPQPAQLFTLALHGLSDNAFNLLAQKPNWNLKAATFFLPFAYSRDCFEAALVVAEPFYQNLAVLRNEHQEFISCVFDLLFDLGEDAVRLPLLHDVCDLKQAPSLQSIAHQRLAMIHSQRGEAETSQYHLQQAFRCDPNQDELALAELSILGMLADEDELKARAKFWQVRLLKKYDDHPALELIENILENGQEFFEHHREMMDFESESYEDENHERLEQEHAEALIQLFISTEVGINIYDISIADDEAKLSLAKKLKPIYKQWLALYEEEAEAISVDYADNYADNYVPMTQDDIDLHRWITPPPEWLSFLQQHPILINNIEVIQHLSSHIYQAPVPDEGDDIDYNNAESLSKLSIFSKLLMVYKQINASALRAVMDALPEGVRLPQRFKGNKSFWDIASNYNGELSQNLELELQQDYLLQLDDLDNKTPSWLVDGLMLNYFQRGESEDIISLFKRFKNPTLSMTVIAACAYQQENLNHQALSLLHSVKGKNKAFLHYFYKSLDKQAFQSEEFQTLLSKGYSGGMISLASEIMGTIQALEEGHLPEQINGRYIDQCYQWLLRNLPNKN